MKKILFALLALCLVLTFSGCGGGGGGSDDDNGGNGNGGGNGGNGGNGGDNGILTYVTSGLLDNTGVSGYSINNGVMTYTLSGDNLEEYSQLNVDTINRTFELYEIEKLNGVKIVDQTFYGTWTGDGTTSITAHCTHYIVTGESTENPQDWDTVFAIDGNTTYWTSGEPFNWIWTLPQ